MSGTPSIKGDRASDQGGSIDRLRVRLRNIPPAIGLGPFLEALDPSRQPLVAAVHHDRGTTRSSFRGYSSSILRGAPSEVEGCGAGVGSEREGN